MCDEIVYNILVYIRYWDTILVTTSPMGLALSIASTEDMSCFIFLTQKSVDWLEGEPRSRDIGSSCR